MPEPWFWERVAVATNSFIHAAALRAARARHDQVVDDELFRRNLVDIGARESEPPRDVQKRSPDGPTLEATLLVDGLAGAQHAVIVGRVDGHVENGSYPGDQKVVADEDDGLDDLLVAVVRADVGEVPVVDL
jgi:hypothetical protein